MQDISGNFTTSRFLFGDFDGYKDDLIKGRHTVILTDDNVYKYHKASLDFGEAIVIPAGENSKSLKTIEHIAEQLITKKADRKSLIIGIGGGVVTDITGYISTIYMRGIAFGFIPTSLLGMVDAAIGGKNGVNLGLHKNILGTFSQPEFICFNSLYLHTLPDEEWSNGFAEIIKYACLFNEHLLTSLSQKSTNYYKNDKNALQSLMHQCAIWKDDIVQKDEKETGIRKLLNFGHTCGHAIETLYDLPHGQAVSLGIIIACYISEELHGLDRVETNKIKTALNNFNLLTTFKINIEKVIELVAMDKKRDGASIDYITLKSIGDPSIDRLLLQDIRAGLEKFYHAGNH